MLKVRESTHTESSWKGKALDSILGAQGRSQKALGRRWGVRKVTLAAACWAGHTEAGR